MGLLRSTVSPISKVAIIKTTTATIAFFLFFSFRPPRSFFFSFLFPSLVWFWSLSGPRNLPFDAFSLKWRQISLGWFSKNRLEPINPFPRWICRFLWCAVIRVISDHWSWIERTLRFKYTFQITFFRRRRFFILTDNRAFLRWMQLTFTGTYKKK